MKLESAIESFDAASREKSKSEFLFGLLDSKRNTERCKTIARSFTPQPLELPEKQLNLCSAEEFQELCHSRNFMHTKSDPLKCHIDRVCDLDAVAVGEAYDCTMLVSNYQSSKRGTLSKFLTAELHCCHDDSSQRVNMKKITNEKYLLSFSPQKLRGRHELHIKYTDAHICGSPIPLFVTIPPHQLKKISSKQISDVGGVKFHRGKLYAIRMERAIKVLDSVTLSVEASIKVSDISDVLVDSRHIYATSVRECKLIKMSMNGTIVKSTGRKGSGPGQFNFPSGIQLSKDNELYVCDSRNNRIQIFDKDLNFIRILGKEGSTESCLLNSPNGLDFDDSGNIYIVDHMKHAVKVMTPQGQYIRNIGRPGTKLGELNFPGSAVVHRGLVYITDYGNSCVSVFKTTGEFVSAFGKDTLSHPVCLAIDDKGFVYVMITAK